MDKHAVIEDLRASIASLESGGIPSHSDAKRKGSCTKSDAGPFRLKRTDKSHGYGGSDEEDCRPLYAKHCLLQAIGSLTASDQPSSKIRRKLIDKGYPETIVEQTIEKLEALGYLDDMRYAENYLRSKYSQGKGIPGILRELRASGIDTESLATIIDEITVNQPSEDQRAYDYLVAHPPRSKNLREGAYRKLITRGFSSDDASRAARLWVSSQENA